jgi:hypothetical protein
VCAAIRSRSRKKLVEIGHQMEKEEGTNLGVRKRKRRHEPQCEDGGEVLEDGGEVDLGNSILSGGDEDEDGL